MDLTQRRKAETEQHIARVAAELFAAKGVSSTTVEEIAAGAGIGVRTFYRYFRTKQEAVGPLLAFGARRWRELLAAVPPDVELPAALEQAARRSMAECDADTAASFARTRGLLAAAAADAELRAVWVRVNDSSERQLVRVITERAASTYDAFDIALLAAAATTAIRVAMETWAGDPNGTADTAAQLTGGAVRTLTAGLRR
ncbi:TetR family transcriptional regulator [Nocardia sp. NPDC058633]|uniref:TetR family transcriptional regulator n=1 Tax=Nocardia sp. NPDC058633 TaxID=3346568 RepID=UPI00365E0C10